MSARVEKLYTAEAESSGWAPVDPGLAATLIVGGILSMVIFEDWVLAGIDPPPGRDRIVRELVAYAISGATGR